MLCIAHYSPKSTKVYLGKKGLHHFVHAGILCSTRPVHSVFQWSTISKIKEVFNDVFQFNMQWFLIEVQAKENVLQMWRSVFWDWKAETVALLQLCSTAQTCNQSITLGEDPPSSSWTACLLQANLWADQIGFWHVTLETPCWARHSFLPCHLSHSMHLAPLETQACMNHNSVSLQ